MDNDRLTISLLVVALLLIISILVMRFTSVPAFNEPIFDSKTISAEDNINAQPSTQNIDPSAPAISVRINVASVDELKIIPEIGTKTAQRIVDYRTNVGTIADINELLAVEGIGEKTLETLKKYCVLN